MITICFEEQNKILRDWIEINYGERCPDFEKDCIVCKAWKMFDELKYPEREKGE